MQLAAPLGGLALQQPSSAGWQKTAVAISGHNKQMQLAQQLGTGLAAAVAAAAA